MWKVVFVWKIRIGAGGNVIAGKHLRLFKPLFLLSKLQRERHGLDYQTD